MKFYRAKEDISFSRTALGETFTIFKSQLFLVQDYTELPVYNGEKEVKEHWEEWGLYNNYGTVEMRWKP